MVLESELLKKIEIMDSLHMKTIKALYESFEQVGSSILNLTVNSVDIDNGRDSTSNHSWVVMSGFTGDIFGIIHFIFNEKLAEAIITQLLGDDYLLKEEELSHSCLTEFTNIILGTTISALSLDEYEIELSLPVLVKSHEATFFTLNTTKYNLIFNTSIGQFLVDICLPGSRKSKDSLNS